MPRAPKTAAMVAILAAAGCAALRGESPYALRDDDTGPDDDTSLDDDTTAGAADDADAAGVRAFFDQSKGRTATIGVFSKDRKELFRTWGLKNEAELRQALDAAATP